MRLQRRGDGGGYDSIAVAIGVRVMRWIETTIRCPRGLSKHWQHIHMRHLDRL